MKNMLKNWLRINQNAPHEEMHNPSGIEFSLAIIIALVLSASLLSQQFFPLPNYIIPFLIIFFVGVKIRHIIKKGGTLLEDYAAIGVIFVFLVLYFILKAKLNPILIIVFILILFYSAGLMLWVRTTFGSKRMTHFIASYIITIFLVIFLFTGAYLSNESNFNYNGVQKSLAFEDAIYFSAVTLTTVGYGDITPTGLNRFLAALEAIIGMIINVALLGYVLSYGRRDVP